jgi:hypothetical protein
MILAKDRCQVIIQTLKRTARVPTTSMAPTASASSYSDPTPSPVSQRSFPTWTMIGRARLAGDIGR